MEITSAISGWLADVIRVLPLVKLACTEEKEVTEFGRCMDVGLHENIRAERLQTLTVLVGKAARWFVPSVVYLFGAWLVYKDTITTGKLLMFGMFVLMINQSIQSTIRAAANIDDGLVAFQRINDILKLKNEIGMSKRRVLPHKQIREIAFENVSFSYPLTPELDSHRNDRSRRNVQALKEEEDKPTPVLFNIDMQVSAGTPAVLVGESGTGKSTLMKLLCGFYTPDSGCILVDGVDLRDLDVQSYRQHLSQISHEGYLLSRDFFDNVLYRVDTEYQDDPLLQDVISHLRLNAVSSRELKARGRRRRRLERGEPDLLPPGLDAPGTLHLSAGERQRLSIIRELVHDANLWGLDEVTSNLDGELEERVLQMLMERDDIVLLAVSHRLSFIHRFPLIYVMHEGRIVASGTHKELMVTCPEYQRLVKPQLVGIKEIYSGCRV